MNYLAILGRQPKLSLAELEAVLGPAAITPLGQHALVKTAPDLDRLGGTIKLGRVIADGPQLNQALWSAALAELPQPTGKLTLGLSYYGARLDPLRLAMQLKQQLRASGQSVRLVLPKPGRSELTAAQLKFNRLTTPESPELVIYKQPSRTVIATTTRYQNIDAYSARDFARPDRSAKVGMLPPKLAQILVNLAGIPLGTILDPFCGSGVILQEGLLAGYAVIGTDTSPKMVQAATANLRWLESNHPKLPAWLVAEADVRDLKIWPRVSAIVTESYLGQPFDHRPTNQELARVSEEVSALVRRFLENLASQVKPGFIVVLCLPAWQTAVGTQLPAVIDEISRLGYTIRQFLHADSDDLIYLRPGQFVGRKILVIKRK